MREDGSRLVYAVIDILNSHAMDHTLAVYALGGSPEAIAEVYGSHDYNDPIRPSPESITDANFFKHLGDAEFVHLFYLVDG